MKRISFLVFSIILIIAGTDAQGRNELKFNLAKSAFSFPELSYEYVLNKNMSIGSALGVGVNPENYLGYKYMFLPNYRWFFAGSGLSSHKNASGFFLEANAAIFSQNSYTQEGEFAIYPGESIYDGYGHLIGSNNQVIDTRHDVILNTSGYGLGAALGFKFVSRNNWIAEAFGGIGNNFKHNLNKRYYNQIYPQLGISIGKRF